MSRRRPECIAHPSELPDNGGTVWSWTGSDEVLGVRTPLARPLGLKRLGVHHDVLAPGQRSSLPHAERWEEECVYVLEGHPSAWIDGASHRLGPDDFVAFSPRGVRHTIVNDGDAPVRLLVVGEVLDAGHRAAEAMAACWHGGDDEAMARAYADDCVLEDAASGRRWHGRAEIAATLREHAPADAAVTLDHVMVSGARVAVEWSERWPDGARRGASALELAGGRIRERRDYPTGTASAAR